MKILIKKQRINLTRLAKKKLKEELDKKAKEIPGEDFDKQAKELLEKLKGKGNYQLALTAYNTMHEGNTGINNIS